MNMYISLCNQKIRYTSDSLSNITSVSDLAVFFTPQQETFNNVDVVE